MKQITHKELFNELKSEDDMIRFYDIMEYFMYKTLKQIEEDNISDNFIWDLESFSGEAEKLENKIVLGKEPKEFFGNHKLSDFFFTLSQLLTLKKNWKLKDEWAKSFKRNILKGGKR